MRLGRAQATGLRMSEELDRLAKVMQRFADEELQGSSPLYERLARGAAREPALLEPLLAAPTSQRRATLYFAAIHYLVLDGARDDLAAFFPDVEAPVRGGDPVSALREFVRSRRDDLEALYATRNTQTNEVGRCAFLLPMFGHVAARAGRPLAMIEAGASAGFNLLFDRYRYDYGEAGAVGDPASAVVLRPETSDRVPVPDTMPGVASRIGVDLQPVDVRDDTAIAWLHACIWPEHADRVQLFTDAVAIARNEPPTVVRGDVLETLPRMIDDVPAGTPVCVFHTATLAYFDRDQRARFGALMAGAGRAREVWWVAGEGRHILGQLFPQAGIAGPADGYALVAARAGGEAQWVGEAAFHGRWIRWRPA
jgi:hypothetical protein